MKYITHNDNNVIRLLFVRLSATELETIEACFDWIINNFEIIDSIAYKEEIPRWNDEGTRSPEEMVLITQSVKEVGQIMSAYVGIVRSNLRLKRALDRLEILYRETENLFRRSTVSPEICELRNIINIGYLIITQAMQRKESRGLHYTIDYPKKNEL